VSLKTLEAVILRNAREALKNTTLRQKDIMEWSTGKITSRDDEVVVYVDDPGVYVAVKKEHDKRVKP